MLDTGNAGASESVSIETMTEQDWTIVRSIYSQGIATGNATFEPSAPDWEKWDAGHLRICRLVARSADEVLGWAALSPVSSRRVYSGVAEVSVYVSERARGQKIGSRLLRALVRPLNTRASGLCRPESSQRTLQASNSTNAADSSLWEPDAASAAWMDAGAMCFSWSAGASAQEWINPAFSDSVETDYPARFAACSRLRA